MRAFSTYNIVVPKGAVFLQTFGFRHGLRLFDDLLPGSGSSKIAIEPLPIDLPANYRLRFPIKPCRGCSAIDLVTATTTLAGSDSINILPYGQDMKVPRGAVAQTLPRDLSGQVWRAAARKEYVDASPLLQFGFEVDPSRGLVTMRASASLTAALTSNAIYSDLPEDLQSEGAFPPRIWQRAYYWDAEYELPTGDVHRAFYGRAWVVPEATRG
jgi:hypothetical protein